MYSYYKIEQVTKCVDVVGTLGFHCGIRRIKNKPCGSFITERVKRQRYPAVVSTSSDQIIFS